MKAKENFGLIFQFLLLGIIISIIMIIVIIFIDSITLALDKNIYNFTKKLLNS